MFARIIIGISIVLIASPVVAVKLSCNIEQDHYGPTYLELEISSKVARILVPGGLGIVDGRITLVSRAGNGTDKYNLLFTMLGKPFENEIWEFVLHRNSGEWAIFGVGYVEIGGARHLSSTRGLQRAVCIER